MEVAIGHQHLRRIESADDVLNLPDSWRNGLEKNKEHLLGRGTQHRIIEAIRELADYADSHGLGKVHASLELARAAIREFVVDETAEVVELEQDTWFSTALDALISYAGRNGIDEVLDHLLKAKMAWDERKPKQPDGNILSFRRRQK